MTIKIAWDTEAKTILIWTFTGGWTWEEYRQAYDEAVSNINSVTHPVGIICDFTNSSMIPSNALSFTRVRTNYQPHISLITFATRNTFIRSMVTMVTRLARTNKRFVIFEDVDQARAAILRENEALRRQMETGAKA